MRRQREAGQRRAASGSLNCQGGVEARELSISGSMRVQGDLRADDFRVSGSLRSYGNVEAETFDVSGSFRIDGLLNASRVDIRHGGGCTAREIGGDSISVKTGLTNVFWKMLSWVSELFGLGKRGALRAELIEGTHLDLEWTHARVVRGNRVFVGPGCLVDLVEYTESAYVDPEASVGEVRQIQ